MEMLPAADVRRAEALWRSSEVFPSWRQALISMAFMLIHTAYLFLGPR